MENSAYTAVTLDIFETMWQQGYRNAGVVLQSYLQRSRGRRAAHERSSARACGWSRARTRSREASPTRRRPTSTPRSSSMMKVLLTDGTYPAIATHDPAMIAGHARVRGEHADCRPDRFEFQMLYGIRRDLQTALVAGRLPRARLHSVRPRMVPVLHAPARRTARQRRLRPQKSGQRTVKSLPAAGAPPTASCIKAPIARRSADARVWFKPPTISSGPS